MGTAIQRLCEGKGRLTVNHKEFDLMEIRDLLPYIFAMAVYEDYKTFKMVSVLQGGKAVGITSAYDAAKYILEQWPDDAGGPKLETCKAILLKCLAGDCSAAVARVAFIEAAREADIYIETTPQPPSTGKLERWGKRKPARRS